MDWLEQIKNAIIGGAVAESPSVMTASGWKQDDNKNWIQEPSKASQQLAENLEILADAGLTAPTLGADITSVYKFLRHPITYIKGFRETLQSLPIGEIVSKKYIKNKNWDMSVIAQEVKDGIKKAQDYFSSNLRQRVDQSNLEEAKRLGFTDFSPNVTSSQRVNTQIHPKIEVIPKETWRARISPNSDPTKDVLEINLYSPDIENSTFHEIIHRGRLGIAEPIRDGENYQDFLKRVKGTSKFYQYKTDKIFKPRSEIPENLLEGYDYVSDSHEAAANLFELGQRMNIEPGSIYPGDDVVKQLMKNIKNDPRAIEKESIVDFIKDTPEARKGFWEAITGQYYTIPMGLFINQLISNDQ